MATRYMLACLCVSLMGNNVSGEVIFTLSPLENGGVYVDGTGSGYTTDSLSGPDIDFLDYGDFLDDSLGIGIIRTLNAEGIIRNLTAGTAAEITTFSIDNDSNSSDDIDFQFEPFIFNEGDQFEFEMTATFDPSLLMFESLFPGTYTEPGSGGGKEILGPSTLVIVPEPTVLLILVAGMGVGLRRRCRLSH